MVARSRARSRARSQSRDRDRGRGRSQSYDRGLARSQSRDRGRGRSKSYDRGLARSQSRDRGRDIPTRSSRPEKRGPVEKGARNRSRSRGRTKQPQTTQVMARTRSKSKPKPRSKNEIRENPETSETYERVNKYVQYREFGTNATECCRVIAIDQIPVVRERWMVLVKVKVRWCIVFVPSKFQSHNNYGERTKCVRHFNYSTGINCVPQ